MRGKFAMDMDDATIAAHDLSMSRESSAAMYGRLLKVVMPVFYDWYEDELNRGLDDAKAQDIINTIIRISVTMTASMLATFQGLSDENIKNIVEGFEESIRKYADMIKEEAKR